MTTTAPPVRALWSQLEGLEHWGVLDGRENRGVRDVLRTLVHLQHSKAVVITGRQLAVRVGLSERWTRRCLHHLERLGIVRWTRGHIEHGRPRPGWITVRAGRLAQVVRHARELSRTARAEYRATTTRRIRSTVIQHTLWPRKSRHNPLSDQAELSASLPLRGGKDAGAPPPAAPSSSPLTAPGDAMQPSECIHGMPVTKIGDHDRCAMCRKIIRQDPTRTPASLLRPLHDDSADKREVTASGLAAARAAIRQARHTQEPLP